MKLRHIFFPLAIGMVAFAAEPTPKSKTPANRLAQESSPYLLQHAHNPVDWYPWGEEAFAKAKKDGKFIFLSIGYSSCHWCHVMERETFENKDVAKIINENFVCIKVDREERPDIDDIYMTALHVTGSQGGWPLSMFLTSEGKPIFGGTYFPPEDKKISDEDTIPGFKSILKKVIELKKTNSKELHEQADNIAKLTAEELDRSAGFMPIGKMDASWASDAANQYELDPEHGGLGSKRREFAGTKFPRVSALLLLQNQSAKAGQENLAKLFTLTMEKMNEGGIYDHLGGGFHRYSTERTWTVPHFEKMLYDNAQLVELYAKEYARKPREDYRRVIDETLVWMAREMTAQEGYFYSALDADSEGEEGKFYVWEAKELDALLGSGADAKLFRDVYSLNKVNFEDKYYILRLPKSWAELAKAHKLTETELVAKLEPLKKKLLEVRSKRHRPFLDTKLITSWNGQMIAAYALAGQVLKEKRYTEAGEKAAEFILKNLRDKDGRLVRIYAGKPGEKPTAKVRAFLDDYAFLIHGLLALHDATGNKRWLDESVRLQKELQTNFGDDKRGGYFNTPNDGDKLFARGKDSYDGAQPSGNGIAVRNSVRLWVKTQDEAYRANAQKSLRSSSPAMKTAPTSVPVVLDTLDQFIALKGLKDEPAATTEFKAPEKPIDSTDVVKVEAKHMGSADGIDTYTVNIEIAKGWHIYANKVENKTLLDSSTVVEVLVSGKIDPLAEITYPAGSVIEDAKAGNYKVYDGKATIRVSVKHEDKAKVAFQVKLVACNDKVCLKPSTIKVEVK